MYPLIATVPEQLVLPKHPIRTVTSVQLEGLGLNTILEPPLGEHQSSFSANSLPPLSTSRKYVSPLYEPPESHVEAVNVEHI